MEYLDGARHRVLIDEIGLSEEIVSMIPPDTDEANPFF